MESAKKAGQLFDKRQLVETTFENGKIIFLKSLSRSSPLCQIFALSCFMPAIRWHFTNSIISISVQFESVCSSQILAHISILDESTRMEYAY